jgi:hypothetical protein
VKLTIDQTFSASADAVARAYADPFLYLSFPERGPLARPEVIDRVVQGDRIVFRIQHRFVGQVSSAVRRVIDPDKLTWVEHVTMDLTAATAAFRIQPDHYPDRLRCEGVYSFTAHGAGSRRTGQGELRVRAPLVAGAVERAIVTGLQDHLRDEVPVVEAFLRPSA